jgi:hypothetical protein
MTEALAEIERMVRRAAPALHPDDVRAIAADIVRLMPGLGPGKAVDRYFSPGRDVP